MLIGQTHSSPHPYAVVVTVAEAVTAAGEKARQVVHKHSHGKTILFTVLMLICTKVNPTTSPLMISFTYSPVLSNRLVALIVSQGIL